MRKNIKDYKIQKRNFTVFKIAQTEKEKHVSCRPVLPRELIALCYTYNNL